MSNKILSKSKSATLIKSEKNRNTVKYGKIQKLDDAFFH